MKTEIQAAIADAAREAALAVCGQLRAAGGTNYYLAMEKLLYNYKRIGAITRDLGAYVTVEPRARSRDIVRIGDGGGDLYRDADSGVEEVERARGAAYERTRARYEEIDAVIRQFDGRREFAVVRMYYFNEDFQGNDRTGRARYTFEEIAEELADSGLEKSERTVRQWRTSIVRDMAVCMFGVVAAANLATFAGD